MGEGRARQRTEHERIQVDLAARTFSSDSVRPLWFEELSELERRLLFQELKSHHQLHVAQGNEAQCARMMALLRTLAVGDDRLVYDQQRLQIKEFERRGLGGRALELMGQLYAEQGRSRKNIARAAEIVMEFGILHDRYGDKEEAYRLFKNSARRYQRAGQDYNLAAAWFNSASVLYDMGRIKASLRACEQGFKLENEQFLDLRTHLLLQRANCRERTEELDLACQDYLQAASGYGTLKNRRQQINIFFRVGWLLGRLKRSDESVALLEQALRLAQELDYASGLASFHLHRAQFLVECNATEGLVRHLHAALAHAQAASFDRADKLARGLLYKVLSQGRRSLTFYLRAKAPLGRPASLGRAYSGTYAHRGNDGFGTRPWRCPPRSAGKNITFLVRLLAELGRRGHRKELISQSLAVAEWQRGVRQGRRIF